MKIKSCARISIYENTTRIMFRNTILFPNNYNSLTMCDELLILIRKIIQKLLNTHINFSFSRKHNLIYHRFFISHRRVV
ncbi:uncharacterized protein DS421_19g664750 [Arachis hypogaea]|uniref:Uncharacterized protein n=1 Tax=Arachis hypogaea TaxID=3818 RepID=A0A6B9VB93_ARAHY|nr:uncharacterized protein DS421_19g664750 [Arachis hypogaea]